MKYSFIIPLFNEEESLPELYKRLSKIAFDLKEPYELIFVDDGSTDGSFNLLKNLFKNDSQIQIIHHKRNLGKSQALQDGFSASNGEIVITLDADLQDVPEEIPNLLKKLSEGFDLISAWKKDRKDSFNKTFRSKIFNLIVAKFSGLKIHDFNSGLKIYRQELVRQINIYGELHRFIPVIAFNLGFLVAEVPVIHMPRKYGVSKYGTFSMIKASFDFLTIMFLTKFGKRPMHLFAGIGSILTLIGIISGLYLTILRLSGETIGRRPLLFLTMLLIVSGLQFIFTGLLAEMIIHLTPQKPIPSETFKHHD